MTNANSRNPRCFYFARLPVEASRENKKFELPTGRGSGSAQPRARPAGLSGASIHVTFHFRIRSTMSRGQKSGDRRDGTGPPLKSCT
mmetsp:Transcript_5186/g.10529  ORF Transcript_5186/g.10529 Transcript_5186/m.10529 type:complete len:87 (+) Transcript_5186:58-318(+)